MPPPAYTARRRLTLQVVLVLVFAGTMGLAAAVRYQRQNEPPIPLDRKVMLGDELEVRLPTGWQVSKSTRPAIPLVRTVEAVEPVDPKVARSLRTIQVSTQAVDPGTTPEQHLRETAMVSGGSSQPVPVAGQPGVMITEVDPNGYKEGVPISHVYAAAVLNNERVVVVEVEIIGRKPATRDEKLLKAVAAGVQSPVSNSLR